MPEFMSRALFEASILPIKAEIIKIKVRSGQPRNRRDGVESPKFLARVRVIIEHTGLGSHRFDGKGVDSPVIDFDYRFHTIKTETHIL